MTRTSGLLTLVFTLFTLTLSYAQHGILPGESDPNTSPNKDTDVNHEHGTIDDRGQCKKGTKKFQKMKCGDPKEQPECKHYSPVLECHKKSPVLHCKKPQIPVPVYQCEQ